MDYMGYVGHSDKEGLHVGAYQDMGVCHTAIICSTFFGVDILSRVLHCARGYEMLRL